MPRLWTLVAEPMDLQPCGGGYRHKVLVGEAGVPSRMCLRGGEVAGGNSRVDHGTGAASRPAFLESLID